MAKIAPFTTLILSLKYVFIDLATPIRLDHKICIYLNFVTLGGKQRQIFHNIKYKRKKVKHFCKKKDQRCIFGLA